MLYAHSIVNGLDYAMSGKRCQHMLVDFLDLQWLEIYRMGTKSNKNIYISTNVCGTSSLFLIISCTRKDKTQIKENTLYVSSPSSCLCICYCMIP